MMELAKKWAAWWATLNLAQKLGLWLAAVCAMLLFGSIVAQIVDPPKESLTLEQIFGPPAAMRPDAGPEGP